MSKATEAAKELSELYSSQPLRTDFNTLLTPHKERLEIRLDGNIKKCTQLKTEFFVQQQTLEYWYDLKPAWDDAKNAHEHMDECIFHMPKETRFRVVERTTIEKEA